MPRAVPPELPLRRLPAAPLTRPPLAPMRPFSGGGQSRATIALNVDGRSSRHHDCHACERLRCVRSALRDACRIEAIFRCSLVDIRHSAPCSKRRPLVTWAAHAAAAAPQPPS